ncbi:2-C-methyl-D-erythritol 4-phosphate cytidylyltransferase [Akkermansiaceae bacterium]|nr:2-C-methyl-D-erythritol 4-phosphate cytidylyltransferase [Akkermansiaceae bacterium]
MKWATSAAPLLVDGVLIGPKEAFENVSGAVQARDGLSLDVVGEGAGAGGDVDGGVERPDSVAAGLAALKPEITHVAIHDGARPCISANSIRAAFSVAEVSGAAALARPVTETLKRATPDGITTESVSRDDLWIMETPQIFEKTLICEAYQNVGSGDAQITDEVSALQLLGKGTTLVENTSANPKITVQADLDSLT